MPEQKKKIPPKERTLMVLTREEGVREENPLLKTERGYYLPSYQRTPALRKEADELMPPTRIIRKGLTVGGKAMEQKYLKQKGY